MVAAKRIKEARTIGRSQEGRPHATPEAHKHSDGERALVGALSVPIEQIHPDPGQPRKETSPERLQELAGSLATYGVLQPLVVREAGLLDDGRTSYMIVAGGRRYAAAIRAGLTRLPVLVRDSEGAVLRILQLTENLQREALEPVDEARAFRELMDLETLDTRAVASRVHRSHTYVADRLKLIVHEDVARAVAGGTLTPSAATEVAREADATRRQALIQRARQEGLQKRDVQRLRREAPPNGGQRRADGGEPTLREMAREMGADEAAIRAAAIARREEPSLSNAEALALAMSAADLDGAQEEPFAEVEATIVAVQSSSRGMAVDEETAFVRLISQAGGVPPVLALLDWATAGNLSLAELRRRVARLTSGSTL